MPKKIKTRKQKLQSDLRKQTSEVSYTLPVAPKEVKVETKAISPIPQVATTQVADYHHLKTDLWKTLLFSVAIVTLELVLRFFVITS